MTFEPPAMPQQPQPQPQQQTPAYQQPQQQQPSYAQPQPQHPGYGQQPQQGYTQPQSPQQQAYPGYGQQPQQSKPPRAKNTMGLVSAILGASSIVLGFIFSFIQLSIFGSGNPSLYAVVNGTQTVLNALLGLGAVILGVLGYLKGGPSKLLAIVGTTLGVSLLIGVLNGLLYSFAAPLFY
ncbi:hypothetical protein ITJ38_14695 [Agreia pratensis]|uniref:hypothetical protein n=1 Tax=Agreia pratensis TaxID=150121 RepID=UPI001889E024|nr:hypothetical protein [Agreia pratensis]MBF4635659.1 hypothetical protein [Agreia pratensis]